MDYRDEELDDRYNSDDLAAMIAEGRLYDNNRDEEEPAMMFVAPEIDDSYNSETLEMMNAVGELYDPVAMFVDSSEEMNDNHDQEDPSAMFVDEEQLDALEPSQELEPSQIGGHVDQGRSLSCTFRFFFLLRFGYSLSSSSSSSSSSLKVT